jgi:CDP-diacylglycerol--glycerol-3-phosphate 3-phosphatidyltransferase
MGPPPRPQADNKKDGRPFRLFPASLTARLEAVGRRSSSIFSKIKVHPDVLSAVGSAAGLAAGALFALDRPVWAGALVFVCGAFDVLDGLVAVHTKRQTSFGAIFDSSLDRYADFFILAGLAFHFRGKAGLWLAFAAFLGAVMVSYTRARAEGLGFDCRVGIMQRSERLILLGLTGLAGPPLRIFDPAMSVVLGLIALLSNVAAWQRILLVRKLERRAASAAIPSADKPPAGERP